MNANKWLDEYMKLLNGLKATCPKCGGSRIDYGYETLKGTSTSGFGAIWCEDCRSAFILCRVILTDDDTRKKIIPALPADLKFV